MSGRRKEEGVNVPVIIPLSVIVIIAQTDKYRYPGNEGGNISCRRPRLVGGHSLSSQCMIEHHQGDEGVESSVAK